MDSRNYFAFSGAAGVVSGLFCYYRWKRTKKGQKNISKAIITSGFCGIMTGISAFLLLSATTHGYERYHLHNHYYGNYLDLGVGLLTGAAAIVIEEEMRIEAADES